MNHQEANPLLKKKLRKAGLDIPTNTQILHQ